MVRELLETTAESRQSLGVIKLSYLIAPSEDHLLSWPITLELGVLAEISVRVSLEGSAAAVSFLGNNSVLF